MKIAECRVVGAMVAPRGNAAFDRANVVVESTVAPGAYLQVRAYLGAHEIEGKPLTQEDWKALVRSAQAIALEPVALPRRVLADAVASLTILAADESLSLVYRAENWHNLGVAQDTLGLRNEAIASFERAATINPFLDAAREELERLRPPQPSF
jgi:tetratricopeptide (TPR) repeat protein